MGRDEALLSGVRVEREASDRTRRKPNRVALLAARSLAGKRPSVRLARDRNRWRQADAPPVPRRQFQLQYSARAARSAGAAASQSGADCAFRCACATHRSSCASRRPTMSSAKYLRVDGITADAAVDTAALTRYQASGAFEQSSPRAVYVVRQERRDCGLRDASRARAVLSGARAGELLRRHGGGSNTRRRRSKLRRAHLRARRRAERNAAVPRRPAARRRFRAPRVNGARSAGRELSRAPAARRRHVLRARRATRR